MGISFLATEVDRVCSLSVSVTLWLVFFLTILLIAYSASAVIVNDGLTPGLAGMTEPSIIYSPL